ncbi:hypothetical protein [Streptomyces sp. NPDC127103]|uniref:hypothetical protein n=1 Tax=Streptomyces sp. NPDC127103 TaxID=3347139 RepID=UPI00365B85A3
MSTIVLVHGIAQEQRSADALEAEWIPALSGGVRNAGFPELADGLWRNQRPGDIEIRMAFYGDKFLREGSQGAGSIDGLDLESEIVDELAVEWLENARDSTNVRDAGNAAMELASLAATGEAQGVMRAATLAANGLDRIPWMTRSGLAVAGRMNRAISQVGAYLSDGALRAEILSRMESVVREETKVVIAHSLGSVAAYEFLRDHSVRIPLFITLGSPLGLQGIRKRLLSEPKFPAVGNWINLADRDDVVAARPHLQRFFDVDRPADAIFGSTFTVDNGASAHDACFYLSKRPVCAPVAKELRRSHSS